MIAPFKRKRRTIAVDPGIRDLFQLIKSDAWPPMMEKHLGLDPGSYPTAVPSSHLCLDMCRREGREHPKHHRRLATPEVLRL